GTVILTLAANSVTDTANNNGPSSSVVNTVTIDRTGPTVSSINRVTATPTNTTSVDFLVTFNESVSGPCVSGNYLTDFSVVASVGITGAAVTACTPIG